MRRKLMKWWFFAVGAILLASLGTGALPAQPAGKGAKKQPALAEPIAVQGTVKQFTAAPKGEVDGVMLADGTWVHWPPHLADRFADFIVKGDKVKVIGWLETGPKGDTKVEVSTLTNLRTGKVLTNDDRPPPPIGKLGQAAGGLETMQGTVKQFTSAPKGEVDGVLLTDGTWVHWPPHLGKRFGDFIDKGDKVKVLGRFETGPKGDTKFEVATLTNLRTGEIRENPDLPVPVGGSVVGEKQRTVEQRLQALEDRLDELLQEIRRIKGKK